jgi:hypothetical protein
MFGLAERGRLTMYEKTLAHTMVDAEEGAFFQRLALTPMLAWFFRTTGVEARGTLRETIETIPSAYLAQIDCHLVRSIVAPENMDEMPHYQALTALNGLVFVRVVEVSRPELAQRAQRLRESILTFYEPAYTMTLEMLASAAQRQSGSIDGANEAAKTAEVNTAPLTGPHELLSAQPKVDAPPDTTGEQSHSHSGKTGVPHYFSSKRSATIVLVVVGLGTSALLKTVFSGMHRARMHSYAYVAPSSPTLPSQPSALISPTVTAPPIPDFATTTTNAATQSQWSVSVSREDDTVPASVRKREDVADLIGKETCASAKDTTQELYHQRAAQDRPVSVYMMEERMAVDFLACHPEANTWSSDE